MKEYPILFSGEMVRALLADRKHVTRRLSKQWLKVKAGDRLWVRETWTGTWCYEDMHLVYAADGSERFAPEAPSEYCLPKAAIKPGAWVSPLFLPRWASRILLECEEDARAERLQDITWPECVAEGCLEDFTRRDSDCPVCHGSTIHQGPTWEFRYLWHKLHTKPGERLEDNPTVCRVGRFRRIA
jgi:hypothetical protein